MSEARVILWLSLIRTTEITSVFALDRIQPKATAWCGSRWKAVVYTFSPPTIQSSHVAIAMYLTLCAMLLRCLAMRLAGWGVCDVRWIAGGMCDPELLSTKYGVYKRGGRT